MNSTTAANAYIYALGAVAIALVAYITYRVVTREADDRLEPRQHEPRALTRLRDLISFGTDTLLYADLGPSQTTWSLSAWKDRCEQWKDHVFEALGEWGATAEQKKHFQELGEFKKRKFRGINAEHEKLRERLAERLRRLREITGSGVERDEERSSASAPPRISIEVAPGTARMPDGRMMPSADVIVDNSGSPFTLVSHATLLAVAPGFDWDTADRWEYEPRLMKGGHGKAWFHIATLSTTGAESGTHWLVKVRGEHMGVIRRWEGHGELWFDVQWLLYTEIESMLKEVGRVRARVLLAHDQRGFVVLKTEEEIVAPLS